MTILAKAGAAISGLALVAASGPAYAGTTRADAQLQSLAGVFATDAVSRVAPVRSSTPLDAMLELVDGEVLSLVAPMVSLSCTSAQAGCVLPLRAPEAAPPPPPISSSPVDVEEIGGAGFALFGPVLGLAGLVGGGAVIAATSGNEVRSNGAS